MSEVVLFGSSHEDNFRQKLPLVASNDDMTGELNDLIRKRPDFPFAVNLCRVPSSGKWHKAPLLGVAFVVVESVQFGYLSALIRNDQLRGMVDFAERYGAAMVLLKDFEELLNDKIAAIDLIRLDIFERLVGVVEKKKRIVGTVPSWSRFHPVNSLDADSMERLSSLTVRASEGDASALTRIFPPELWLLIFSSLPLKDLVTVSSVCWEAYDLANDAVLWNRMCPSWFVENGATKGLARPIVIDSYLKEKKRCEICARESVYSRPYRCAAHMRGDFALKNTQMKLGVSNKDLLKVHPQLGDLAKRALFLIPFAASQAKFGSLAFLNAHLLKKIAKGAAARMKRRKRSLRRKCRLLMNFKPMLTFLWRLSRCQDVSPSTIQSWNRRISDLFTKHLVSADKDAIRTRNELVAAVNDLQESFAGRDPFGYGY